MKISVIIPAYNAQQWVAQCIENVLCQTYKNLEIIVIDDGSTDSTAEIARKYPINLLQQENRGLSAARNRGIDAATGDYIHFFDADDCINVDFYTRMVAAIQLSDADLAFGGVENENQPSRTYKWHEQWLLVSNIDKFDFLNIYEYGYCWRYLISRRLLQKAQLRFPEGKLLEDIPFTLAAVLHANKAVTVPGASYTYKRRTGSILNKKDKEFSKRRQKDWEEMRDARDAFMIEHDLTACIPSVDRWQYKLFGLPLLMKKREHHERKTKWYLLGIQVFNSKKLMRRL